MTDNHYKLCDADAEALGHFGLDAVSVLALGIPWEAATLVTYNMLKHGDRIELETIIDANCDCVPLAAQGELIYCVYTGSQRSLFDRDDQRELIEEAHQRYMQSSLVGLPLDLADICASAPFCRIPAFGGWGDVVPWRDYIGLGLRYTVSTDLWREYARAMLTVGRIHFDMVSEGCDDCSEAMP